ncbi:MAG: formate dehydrogenase-N subunit alpha [Candidatus Rokubacteria bacterium RIFCSPHIGHO2_12_FULL_73_22]|nr:MAG: formate dehydrogenase-N subunit alpha [Candidatus Rokubacteria bacterium RIFCSPHIGHO2_12_FULL_73_22]OGL21208.1 MAG: formate dehydrogenase-N subunit alpha [Candidatus Rokubacteria bacterium RIFCSPLOWO2_12_FULL_73_47]
MTTNLIDMQNSDVIMVTSNMAENHPVGFQWVMKAKERGATIIHVDPRFTRTSAAADMHVPLRSGTNIVFFGGLIKYAIDHNLYFKDYVVHYTNASFLIDPGFKTPTELSGVFTGLDDAKRSYDRATWKYQLDAEGNPKRDLTLKDPRSVFQLLRRHYSRYTVEMVERVCGIPRAKFEEVAKTFCGASGPEKTGSITYALNLTQHTNGVQNIRALCMLQILLGNIGRPGGGVVALRGHANVQGATDLMVLYHNLPGYMNWPLRDAHPDLKTYNEKETPKGGYWVNKPKFLVSLLKAWFGDAGTKENDFGYDWLPKRASGDAYSHQHMFVDMYNGVIKGFLADGQNPAVGGPNAKLARAAMQRLDWLVVVDIFLTETAEVWKAPGTNPKDVKTEVFFIPAAPAAEKDGSLTNTMRLIQWHERAVKPPGDVQTDAQFVCTLAHRLQKLYAGSKQARDKGFLAANFTYGPEPDHPDMLLVLKEVNGFATQDLADKDGKPMYRKGQAISTFAHLRDDGSTASGCWIYTGVVNETPDGKIVNKAAGRKPADAADPLAHGWAFAWPANRRIIYNRAAADLAGKPWSEKKKLIWWDPEAPGAAPDKKGKWVGLDVPDFNPFLAPDAKNGDKPFIMRTDLVGAFFGPLADGPFPEHYEPIESPVRNLLSKRQNNPVAKIWKVPDGKNELAPVGSPDYPYVITTYRLTEHHLSGVMSRYLPMLAELHYAHFTEISHELARELGIANGDMVTVSSPRGKIHVKAMVTNRLKPFIVDGKTVHQIGVPWHWGFNGVPGLPGSKGDITNDLSATVGDPTVFIQETKAFVCNVKKGVV